MASFRKLFRLIGREPSPADDIAAEFEAHLELKVEALIREGLSPAEARREAEKSFGPKARFAAECGVIDRAERRERRWRESISGALQDLRQAVRALIRSPGFALTTILVLAAGIGLNATVFALLRGVVLRPLPFPHSDRLVAVHSSNPVSGWPEFSVSPPDFLDWSREAKTMSAMVAWNTDYVAATGSGPAEEVPIAAVTAGFLAVTGVAPTLGRSFNPGEFERGGPRVVLLSYGVWAGRFGRDPHVVGGRWTLDGESYEILGVMPSGFTFPIDRIGAWVPFRMPENVARQRGAHYLEVAGRLADAATLDRARAELVTLAARIEKDFPASSTGWTVLVRPLHEEVVRDARPTLLLLMTGVGLLLVLACVNVANLVLVRSIGRGGEVALRSALGAGRARLLWHGASEVLVLLAASALLALPIAALGTGLVRKFAPAGVPRIESVGIDPVAMLFTLGTTAIAALLVGLAPARRIARADVRQALAVGGSRSLGARRGSHRWIVALETAVALALLSVAGVLIKTRERLNVVDPGFDRSATLVADLSLPDKRYPTGDALSRFQDDLLGRLRALPGVESASLIFGLPLTDFGFSSSFTIDSVPVPDDVHQSAQLRLASAEYFNVQRIPVLQGRGFTAEDRRGGRRVALVSAAAARRFWPDGKVLGHWVRMSASPGDDSPSGEIVGIVGDVREERLDAPPRPIVYFSSDQTTVSYVTLALRVRGTPLALAPELRRIVTALDPELPLSRVRSMDDVVRAATASYGFRAWVMGFFALLAASLAGIGVYGVISHIVAQRSREMGLRRALGASDRQVVREVVGSGMRDAAVGAVAGLGLGWLITLKLGDLLFQVKPGDPVVLGIVAVLFLGITLLGCWLPARRAARNDPALVLRGE